MLRTMLAMGIGSSVAGCGSSSAAPGVPPPPPPPPPPGGLPSPRPGDWPGNVGVGRSVVILGGGIAGMTTALEMTRLGYSCTILEATPMTGGRVRTIRAGDVVDEVDSAQTCMFDFDDNLYFNPGAARIPHHHEFLLGYCREFGVALETFTNDNRAALLQSTSSMGGQAVIARRVRADTRGHIARLLATAINQNALDAELTATDKTNVLTMLQQFGDLDGNFNYTGTSRAGFPGQENTGSRQRGERVNPLQLQDLVTETFWQQRQGFPESLNQQAMTMQPVGGMIFASARFRQLFSGILPTTFRRPINPRLPISPTQRRAKLHFSRAVSGSRTTIFTVAFPGQRRILRRSGIRTTASGRIMASSSAPISSAARRRPISRTRHHSKESIMHLLRAATYIRS